jgi:hypothetical protein
LTNHILQPPPEIGNTLAWRRHRRCGLWQKGQDRWGGSVRAPGESHRTGGSLAHHALPANSGGTAIGVIMFVKVSKSTQFRA